MPEPGSLAFLEEIIDAEGETVRYSRFVFQRLASSDVDADGVPDSIDNDFDNDGYVNDQDAFPYDESEWSDTDGDGVGDNKDRYPNDPDAQFNHDGDTEPDSLDNDDDDDGHPDVNDAFPLDPSEWLDSDNDGVGDNSDAFPLDRRYTHDTDGDGVPNRLEVLAKDWSPDELFGPQILGDFWDLADPETRFQDADGLIPASDGDTVTLVKGRRSQGSGLNINQIQFNIYKPEASENGVFFTSDQRKHLDRALYTSMKRHSMSWGVSFKSARADRDQVVGGVNDIAIVLTPEGTVDIWQKDADVSRTVGRWQPGRWHRVIFSYEKKGQHASVMVDGEFGGVITEFTPFSSFNEVVFGALDIGSDGIDGTIARGFALDYPLACQEFERLDDWLRAGMGSAP